MPPEFIKAGAESGPERLQRLLSQGAFDGLKAILLRLAPQPESIYAAVLGANTYSDLLQRLGYQLKLTKQIHIQDCYSRLGQEGGIKAVLPYHDIPTQSSLPTLVNFDATVTTTPKSVAFFDALLVELKKQLSAQP